MYFLIVFLLIFQANCIYILSILNIEKIKKIKVLVRKNRYLTKYKREIGKVITLLQREIH